MALAETGNIVLFAFALVGLLNGGLEGLGVHRELQLVHAFFKLFAFYKIH